MTEREGGTGGERRPKLHPGISIVELKNYYWMKEDLARFARRLGLPAQGSKPELSNRIERRLRGLPDLPEPDLAQGKAPRDAERIRAEALAEGAHYTAKKLHCKFRVFYPEGRSRMVVLIVLVVSFAVLAARGMRNTHEDGSGWCRLVYGSQSTPPGS